VRHEPAKPRSDIALTYEPQSRAEPALRDKLALGTFAAPVTPLAADLRARLSMRFALAIALPAGLAVAALVLASVHDVNPGARAALETTIALSALLAAALLRANLERSHLLSDLLLLCALLALVVVDFVFRTGPALSSGVTLESSGAGRFALELLVSLVLVAAAIAPRTTLPDRRRELITSAVVVTAIVVVLGEIVEELVVSHPGSGTSTAAKVAAASVDPVAGAVMVAAAAISIAAAFAFAARSRRAEPGCGLLAAASVLLAGASLQYLAAPLVPADWVTPREGLRFAAYALLLRAAYVRYAKTRRSEAQAALSSERERIARDLHDGLAQDLACIAAQGQRLYSKVGPEHPLMLATQRALAASRGAIADLWAASAPSTEAALRLIANELEHRFDVEVDVQIETDVPLTEDNDLQPSQRENLLRIVREAIVNAALHGAAQHIDVVLLRRGRDLIVRVSDDGRGIMDTARPGFGLRTMRDRAAALGGELHAYRRADGGTELELLVS
jgi:signal transduction histidine kinase